MTLTAGGVTYRVSFVHSAHDIRARRAGAPGSHRQLVDNLALSLHRRVTLCEISEVTPEVAVNEKGFEVHIALPVGQGFSICHYVDQFNKARGRDIAFLRALKASTLSAQTRDELSILATGYTFADLKASLKPSKDIAPVDPIEDYDDWSEADGPSL